MTKHSILSIVFFFLLVAILIIKYVRQMILRGNLILYMEIAMSLIQMEVILRNQQYPDG